MFDRLNQGIYWDKFWPLVDGCTPAGPECDRCWRARYQHRFDEAGAHHYLTTKDGKFRGETEIRRDKINLPLHSKKSKVWFVLNDLYHENVPAEFIIHAYEVMSEAKQHIFIVCTKRPERIVPVLYDAEGRYYLGGGDYFPNIWHMTTAGNQEMADKRIPELLKLRQASPGWPVLGVSMEPMLGEVDIYSHLTPYGAKGIDWIVLGGESGTGARPMKPDWARSVRDQCREAGVPFMFKQWGEWAPRGFDGLEGKDAAIIDYHGKKTVDGEVFMVCVGKKSAGRLLDGRTWDELPR